MDCGTTGLDAIYGKHQIQADAIGSDLGYAADSWNSRVFEGTGHSETDWAEWVEIPLNFLLSKDLATKP